MWGDAVPAAWRWWDVAADTGCQMLNQPCTLLTSTSSPQCRHTAADTRYTSTNTPPQCHQLHHLKHSSQTISKPLKRLATNTTYWTWKGVQ